MRCFKHVAVVAVATAAADLLYQPADSPLLLVFEA